MCPRTSQKIWSTSIIKRTLSRSSNEEEKSKLCKKWRKQAKKVKFRKRAKREPERPGIKKMIFRRIRIRRSLKKSKRFKRRRWRMKSR